LPLGFLISATDVELKGLSNHSSDEAFDDALNALFETKLKDHSAVDTGRGHMHLLSYLLEASEDLSSALMGHDIIRDIDDGEITVGFNKPARVVEVYAKLAVTNHDDLNALHTSYESQMASRYPAPRPKKQGFFAKLFGQKVVEDVPVDPDFDVVPDFGVMDESLVRLFDDVCELYKGAKSRQENIITMVMT